ncbi:MAG: YhbY family RNA-binding protein [Clostridiales bacterium]|jgi:RNA-binding protein|nr:YhbY family RNA-binding protein [Clostridiales bacterium]
MLTSKQRAYLRGLAASEDTIIYIGKGDISDNIVAQTATALKARELVKGKVQENSMLTPREACDILCERCRADGVQVIGSKFVLYKRNEKNPRIELPREQKKR